MPTIRELVQALARRDGVDAVVVVGRDGLPIDAVSNNGLDPEGVAALLPTTIRSMSELGSAGERGEFATGVLEFGSGLAVIAVLHAEAMLVILVRPDTNVGTLLFDLRRHRSAIAGLL
jgi:predicted regulator of Ras-like GTPase activity (Roadblock/LC7/MglB family)